MHRIVTTSVASVYPHDVAKVERKGRTQAEMNPRTDLVTGVVCGVRVENVEDLLMQRIRWLDKLVDELAQGKPMVKVLRA